MEAIDGYIIVHINGGKKARFYVIRALQDATLVSEGANVLNAAITVPPVQGDLKARISLFSINGVLKNNSGALIP
ncbi:MAG: hypothetical protein SGJ17_09060 [Hyphomicrobiales bacterium]|nr:hypothetical protein [Hyphomicrobiales bacterium]